MVYKDFILINHNLVRKGGQPLFLALLPSPRTACAAALVVAAAALHRAMSVTLHTDLGTLKLEIYCDIVPRTSFNFLALAASGYYDNTLFHRNIKGFMLQGGDPTGTGKGGESIWGGKFNDEIHPDQKHTMRGVVSMANSGPNTNGSQFFITYAKHPHLDNNCAPHRRHLQRPQSPARHLRARPLLCGRRSRCPPCARLGLWKGHRRLRHTRRARAMPGQREAPPALRDPSAIDHRPRQPARGAFVLDSICPCGASLSRTRPLVWQDQMIIFPSANGPPDIQG